MPLTDDLRVLEKAGLISLAAVRPEPEFTFRHALVHQAVYNTYLKHQRRRVHQIIAEVLEAAGATVGEAQPTDLAYHYFEAGQWAKAMAFARQAGERAQMQYAPREAISLFGLALAAAAHMQAAPPTELLRSRGQAYEVLGDFERAQADYQAGLDQSRAIHRWQDEWQLLLDLGFLWAARDYARTGNYYQQALQLARTMGDDATLAHSLNRLGNWHFNAGENRAALGCHRQAMETFKRLEDRRGLADTLDLLGMVETVIGQLRQGEAHYREAVELFREQDNRLGLASSLSTLAEQGPVFYTDSAAVVMPVAEALAYGQRSIQIAREIGARAAESYGLLSLASVSVAVGDYATALPQIQAGLLIAEEIGHRQWQTFGLTVGGLAWLDLLQPARALEQLEPAHAIAREINSAIWLASTAGLLAATWLALGEQGQAEASLAIHLPPDDAPSLHARAFIMARVQLLLAQHRPEQALAEVEALIETTPEREPGQVVARLWALRGQARAALGQWPEAAADMQAACAASLRQGTRAHTWRFQTSLAEIYTAQQRPDEASIQRAAARALVETLAVGIEDLQVRAAFLERALRKIEGQS